MFTGLVSDVGTVLAVEGDTQTLRRLTLASRYPASDIRIGASIACAGICLTAIEIVDDGAGGCRFVVEAAAETLARTRAGTWATGQRINLERSLKVGDELGGHLVTGHVDGLAKVVTRRTLTDHAWGATAAFSIEAPASLMPFIAEKGSVALDGVSLTVNGVTDNEFSVLLIPHTLAVTTLDAAVAGTELHLEVDLMARYARRLLDAGALPV